VLLERLGRLLQAKTTQLYSIWLTHEKVDGSLFIGIEHGIVVKPPDVLE
jgi:hypothetical protein